MVQTLANARIVVRRRKADYLTMKSHNLNTLRETRDSSTVTGIIIIITS